MTNLSIKKLKWLLVISISLFITLIIYVVFSIKVNDLNHSIIKLVNMQFKNIVSTFDQTENEEKRNNSKEVGSSDTNNHKEAKKSSDLRRLSPLDNFSDTNKISKERVSEEIIPKTDVLQKDPLLNNKRIGNTNDMDIKNPKIDYKNFHSTFGKKVAFIYFSHNRESFLPYFVKGTTPEEAYHSEFNITLVGERLGKSLKYNGIGNTVNDVDMINVLNQRNVNYSSSYLMSRKLVLEEQKSNHDLEMFFDIHRDSLPRKYTTHDINGELLAKVLFVIGSGHENYQENLLFANTLNDMINRTYPGLSKGVIIKDPNQGNGVYNQDLSPNSMIIEIGGVDNTVEELYRSADVLGYIISKYYWDNLH